MLEKVKIVYGGESAEQLYAALNKMKNEFHLMAFLIASFHLLLYNNSF